MKNLVLYDSQYGNTEIIAKEIAESIKGKAILATKVSNKDLTDLDLLVVGSPTQGGRPTVAVQQFLNSLSSDSLKQVRVAAFDTRFLEHQLSWGLKFLVRTIGYAAPKIDKELRGKGGVHVVPPEGFIVTNTEGPLAPGELERASKWLTK